MTRLSPTASPGSKPSARPSVSSLLAASLLEHSHNNRRMAGIEASASAAVSAAIAATAAFGEEEAPRMQRRGDGSLSLGSILDQALLYAREERERNHNEDAGEREDSAEQ